MVCSRTSEMKRRGADCLLWIAATLRSGQGWRTIQYTTMSVPRTIAIALWLSLSAPGMAGGQQQPGAEAIPQTAAAGDASAGKTASEVVPTAEAKKSEPAKAHTTASSAGSLQKKVRRKRRTASTVPDDGLRRVVVREGGAKAPADQIAPGMNPDEAARQRKNAEQLLIATDDQLMQLSTRTLDELQQETVGQIRDYEAGARLALKESDLRRASTLAEKAHLLAEDLLRH